MKLPLEKIAALTVGCAHAQAVGGALRLIRVPAPLQPLYAGDKDLAARMACTASVRLRFHSNTRRLKLALRPGAQVRPIFESVLLVDQRPAGEPGPLEFTRRWEGEIFRQEQPRRRLFDLWLPHLCQMDVLELELDDNAEITAAPPPVRWLAYGDSITQGFFSTVPTKTWVGRCALALDAAVLNVAVGRATLELRLSQCPLHQAWNLITVAYGTNDFAGDVPPARYAENGRKLVTMLHKLLPACPIVVITPVTWPARTAPNRLGLMLDAYRSALTALLPRVAQVTVVPGDELLPDDEAYFSDTVHPNDIGSAHYSERLLPHLQAALQRSAIMSRS